MKLFGSRTANASYKRWIYGFIIPLVIIAGVGYGYWKANPPAVIAAPAFSEQNYYSQLVYAVNEMNNQVEKFDSLRQQGELQADEVQQGRTYVDSLIRPLAAPPEELSVAQAIAEDVSASYHQYTQELAAGNTADAAVLQTAHEQAQYHVELFRQNAKLMTLLNAYKGVNIYCH